MRIDATNARTWLVAAVGGWALLFAVLTLAGLGSRIGTLDDDGTADAPVAAAPVDPAPAPPLSAFDTVAARPLFSGDRRPHPFFIDPQDEGAGEGTGFDYVLTSVMRTPDFALAILQPNVGGDSVRLKIGEAPPDASNWLLDSVDVRSVVFTTPEGPRTLELRVFDGTGGQPPTPITPVATPDGRPSQAASRAPASPEQVNRAAEQAAEAAARAANANANANAGAAAQSAGSAQARGSTAPQQATPLPEGGSSSAIPETAPASGPSEAQVESIRRRIEERRARLLQQQQQQQSNSAQD